MKINRKNNPGYELHIFFKPQRFLCLSSKETRIKYEQKKITTECFELNDLFNEKKKILEKLR